MSERCTDIAVSPRSRSPTRHRPRSASHLEASTPTCPREESEPPIKQEVIGTLSTLDNSSSAGIPLSSSSASTSSAPPAEAQMLLPEAPIDLHSLDKEHLIALINSYSSILTLPAHSVHSPSLERLRRSKPKPTRSRKSSRGSEDEALSSSASSSHCAPMLLDAIAAIDAEPNNNRLKRLKVFSTDAVFPSQPFAPAPNLTKSSAPSPPSEPKAKRSPPRPRTKPPRPPNPWILYRSAQILALKSDEKFSKVPQSEVSKLISYMWRDETPEVKKKYEALAAQAKAQHAQQYPDYSYRPVRKERPATASSSTVSSPASSRSTPAQPSTSLPVGDVSRPTALTRHLSFPPPAQPHWTDLSTFAPRYHQELSGLNLAFEQLPPLDVDVPWLVNSGKNSPFPDRSPSSSSLEMSVNNLLASLTTHATATNALDLSLALDGQDSLWSSPGSTTTTNWGSPVSTPPSNFFTPLAPLSAPAAYATFDFGPVPSPFTQQTTLPVLETSRVDTTESLLFSPVDARYSTPETSVCSMTSPAPTTASESALLPAFSPILSGSTSPAYPSTPLDPAPGTMCHQGFLIVAHEIEDQPMQSLEERQAAAQPSWPTTSYEFP